MTTYKKTLLSGSVDGKAIKIVQTSTPGTLVHTAVAGSVNFDEIWLWVQNNHTADVILTVEFGSADAGDNIIVTVPFKSGLIPVAPGLALNNASTVKAFAGTANVISIFGFVNLITS